MQFPRFFFLNHLFRYDKTQEAVTDTKAKVNVLWKAYEFTDELAPYMEFLEDVRR